MFRKNGLPCHYQGVVKEAVAALLLMQYETCLHQLQSWLRVGQIEEESLDKSLLVLFGRKKIKGPCEMNYAFYLVCKWTRGEI